MNEFLQSLGLVLFFWPIVLLFIVVAVYGIVSLSEWLYNGDAVERAIALMGTSAVVGFFLYIAAGGVMPIA